MRNVRGVFDRRKRCLPAAGKRLLKTKHKIRQLFVKQFEYEFFEDLSGRPAGLHRGQYPHCRVVEPLRHGDRRCAVGDDRHRRQFDSADRPFGEHRRGASCRSFRRRRFPYDDCHAPRDPVRGAACDRCCQERSPHQGNLYPAQRAGYGLDGRVGGVACGDPQLQAGERQVRAGLQRSLRAGRLLPRHGGRRRLSSTRRIARLARNGRQHAIFQGAARQARSQSRGIPSYGLQVQERRGTLHPHEAVRCQSGTVGAVGALDVERHCGRRGRVARPDDRDARRIRRRAVGDPARRCVGEGNGRRIEIRGRDERSLRRGGCRGGR